MTKIRYRVLLVGSLPPPYSGIETANLNFINSGLGEIHDLRVFDAATTRDPSMRGKVAAIQFVSMAVSLVRLVPVLWRFRPQVCVSFMPRNVTGILKWTSYFLLCRLAGSRTIVRFGGTDFDTFMEHAPKAIQVLVRWALRRVDRILVEGESLKSLFLPWVAEERIGIQLNGFDLDTWRQGVEAKPAAETSASETSASESPAGASLKILYLGQVSAAKGVLDILDALGELERRGRLVGVETVIAGPVIEKELNIVHIDNPESTSQSIADRIDTLGLGDRVHFAGEVGWDAKRPLYRDADIFLYPSYSEGFPNAILEAGASGCAVICTPVGAIPDYLTDHQEALLVTPGDSTGLANAIETLRDDPALRSKLSSEIGRFVETRHNFPAFVTAFDGHLTAAATGQRLPDKVPRS